MVASPLLRTGRVGRVSSARRLRPARALETVVVEPVAEAVVEPVVEKVAEPAPPKTPWKTKVHFRVAYETEWGHHLVLVGSHPLLGAWDVEEAVPMDWVEGCTWQVTVELPQFELFEYKYVVRGGWAPGAVTLWQGGPNFLVATNQAKDLKVEDEWVQDTWGDDHPVCAAANAAIAGYNMMAPPAVVNAAENHSLVPDWAREAIFYQIYPLGFFGAPWENVTEEPIPAPVPRLALLRKYYSYMEQLGVDVVYFSPLFESDTHGYDTADYKSIDRRLGDLELFKTIVGELHDRGMKVVLDGVFNHTGRRHFAFKSVMEEGAAASPFGNWYHLGARTTDYEGWCDVSDENGFAFDCWEGHAMLPRLNLATREVREHIFDVATFWLKEVGIDGWRLDVAHEISPEFWREFTSVCLSAKPDCLLVGEMIHGNYNAWVGADRLQSGTNYQLQTSIWRSLNNVNYSDLYEALVRDKSLYGNLDLLNFVGNHDVARIASLLNVHEHYLHATAALVFLPGLPCLYYGDELAMEGRPGEGTDEFSGGDDAMRRPMLNVDDPTDWPAAAEHRLALTKRLLELRKHHQALKTGDLDKDSIVYTADTFTFIRSVPGGQACAVLFNASHEGRSVSANVAAAVAPEGGVFTAVPLWEDERTEAAASGAAAAPAPEPISIVVKDGKLHMDHVDPLSVTLLVYNQPPPAKPKPTVEALEAQKAAFAKVTADAAPLTSGGGLAA